MIKFRALAKSTTGKGLLHTSDRKRRVANFCLTQDSCKMVQSNNSRRLPASFLSVKAPHSGICLGYVWIFHPSETPWEFGPFNGKKPPSVNIQSVKGPNSVNTQ